MIVWHKTHEICDKAVDNCLSKLKLVPDWFVTNKILEKVDAVFSNDNIVFINTDSDYGTFCSDDTDFHTKDLNNVSLDHENFVDVDPETIVHVRLIALNRHKWYKTCIKKDIDK